MKVQQAIVTAQHTFFGLPLHNMDLASLTPVPFQGKEIMRWGLVRRYGNRNWFLIAQLSDGRTVQVNKANNRCAEKWLEAKRKEHKFYNPHPTGADWTVMSGWRPANSLEEAMKEADSFLK
jgi:hypothetical protein